MFLAGSPSILQAQYTDAKIGEYLNYALAATNGSVYVGYNSIGYASPVIYTTAAGWTGLPYSTGFDLSYPYYGYANGVSRDGTVVSGYTWGEVSNGVYVQYAVYWVNGAEQIVHAPPDDPHPTLMAANAVSGDGSTLLVEDTTGSNPSLLFGLRLTKMLLSWLRRSIFKPALRQTLFSRKLYPNPNGNRDSIGYCIKCLNSPFLKWPERLDYGHLRFVTTSRLEYFPG